MIENNIFENLEYFCNKCITGKNDSDKHLLTIFSIALASKGKKYLELGVRDGDTTAPILTAAYLNKGKLISVDKNQTSYRPPDKWKDNYEFVKSDSIKYLEKNLSNEKIDFIYIDDWHAYRHVKREIELIDPYVGPSSIILLHDLMYGNTQPHYHTDLTLKDGQWAEGGAYRAVAELDLNFWEWATLPWNNGLTILRKKYSSKYFSR